MKRRFAVGVLTLLLAAGLTAWWILGRSSPPDPAEPEMESLLPDHTPPPSAGARPLILTPSLALHQENQEHTVEFRVRAVGELWDDRDQVTGFFLMDGPGTLQGPAEAPFATIQVFVPSGLAEQFRARTGKELGRYLLDKPVRVRGTIFRKRSAHPSSDGHLVDHAHVRIDLTGLDQIGVVPSTIPPGSERESADRQEPRPRPRVVSRPALHQPAPALDPAEWLNGEGPGSWEQAFGKVVLLDFWGQWCAPCVRTLSRVAELHAKYKDRGLIVLGVHTPHRSDNLATFFAERTIPFPVMRDTGQTGERYGVEAWPTYYLIDKAGRLAWGFSHTPPTDNQIEALLEP